MRLEISAPPNGRPATDEGEAAPAEQSPTPTPPDAEPAAPPSSAREPPEIAKGANDLEAIKQAVNDAAAVGGGLWLSYLFVLFYLAVAAGAVTHVDLFLENPVKLPFLNIELPLLAFFFLAPILFLVVHAYTLVHLVMLTDKARRFNKVLNNKFGERDDMTPEELANRKAIRDGLRRQLPSNIFVQFLAGPAEKGDRVFRALMMAIAWVSLAVGPVLLLLLIQVQFLAFHNSFITWVHRLALLGDLLLLGWLWQKILAGRERRRKTPGRPELRWAAGFFVGLCVVLFSWTVATFPGEWQEYDLPSAEIFPKMDESPKPDEGSAQSKQLSFGDWIASYRDWALKSEKVSLHDWVFKSPVDEATRRRRLPFSNTLVLTGFNVLEGLGIDDPEKAKWRDFIFLARGRDLKGSRLDFASLTRVDFAGAHLESASLDDARLDRTWFNHAHLQGATLNLAKLQGASLVQAQLQGAKLKGAQLQGASLRNAQLQGASLDGAHLEGASLDHAEAQDASLGSARLQGALLAFAQLQGASLAFAQLQGASLTNAHLEGARLDNALLQGASFDDAQLQGATLRSASLQSTDFTNAFLWRSGGAATWEAAEVPAISLPNAYWDPVKMGAQGDVQPWNDEAYQALRTAIESVPAGGLRDEALKRIQILDCAVPVFESCDYLPPPVGAAWWRGTQRDAVAWREALEKAADVNKKVYAEALAAELTTLVCSGGEDAIYVMRGIGFQSRLRATGAEATRLIDDITNKDSKDCPVAAALTDADRAKLRQIKQEATKKPGG